jgi:hypothetical protein
MRNSGRTKAIVTPANDVPDVASSDKSMLKDTYMNIEDIKRQPISELANLAKDLNVAGASGMRRQDLIFSILQAQAEKNGIISGNPSRRLRFPEGGRLQLPAQPG